MASLTLETTQTIRAIAGTNTAISYTINVDEVGASADVFKIAAQGQLSVSIATLYTVPASTQTLVKSIQLTNTTAGVVSGIKFYIGGNAAANQIFQLTIPANGSATMAANGEWTIYDSSGVKQYVGSTGPTGATGTAATIAAGTTSNLVPGSSATVANSGTSSAAVFDFGIPVGAVWRSGAGVPSNALGVNGDYYLNTTSPIGEVYLKSAGTYSSVGNIRGATGASGVVQTVTATNGTLVAGGTSADPSLKRAAITGPITIADGSNASVVAAQTGTGTTFVMQASPNLTTPTIADHTNAQHTHASAAQGGVIAGSVVTNTPAGNIAATTVQTALNELDTEKFDKLNGVLTGVSSPTYGAGKLVYDTTNESLTFFNNDSNIAQQIGYEHYVKVINNTGVTIAAGAAVYVNGQSAGTATVALARADALATTNVTGITTEAITNGSTGHVTAMGLIHTLNTSAFTAGDVLYLSSSSAGAVTNVAPSGANYIWRVGVVVVSNASTGIILSAPSAGVLATSGVPTSRLINTTAPLTGGGDLTADRTLAVSDATYTTRGTLTAVEKIALNSLDGRTSTGTNPRVFRPGDYMQGNVHDPTGATASTSFTAMMTAIRAWNDRFCIELPPGVFKIDHDVLKDFGTNNPSFSIIGPGRGSCILLPNAAPTGFQSMITLNRNTTGSDSVTLRGFTIYNTSGTPYTAGSGILTNGCDGVDITEVAFIDLYVDVQVSGQPYNMTTAIGTSVTTISPAVSAADNGMVVSGPGIVPGTTFTFVSSSSGTLSVAATQAGAAVRYLNNSIKVSIQKMVSFNTNGNTFGSGIYVSNGQAGDTYMGPDIVMSDGGGTTRRRGCIVIAESGHYEITQCNLTGSQRGIDISPDVSQVVGFGFHTNVLCDSNTVNGMRLLSNSTGSVIKNIKSVNSWYSGTTVINGSAAAAGCLISGTSTLNGFTFTTDRFLNNRTHGCEYIAGTDVRFSDCDMKGNSSAGSGVSDGLNVAANVGDWSINGGKYGGTDTIPGAGNQRYGIFVAAGTGNNIKIGPDSLTGNVTGPLSFGATGVSNFINGCPGLASPYAKPASSGSITTVQTVSNMLIPKNSQRISTTYRLTAQYQHSGAGTAPTFTVRYGATNDAVGSAATNAIVVSAVAATGAASAWGKAEFIVTISATGPTGTIGGSGGGIQGTAAFSTATAARASGAGFLTVATDADRYLTLAVVVGIAGLAVHNATIEIVNY